LEGTGMKYLILIIATEALVELWKKAMPLQGIRRKLTELTPFLEIDGQHLFDCGYCMSVWIGALIGITYLLYEPSIYFFLVLAIHRVSNYVHLGVSYLRDLQLNLRAGRAR
jgi:hypothetical protein